MGDLGQSLPPDTGAKLAQLELGAEQCVAGLGEQEQEHKRARTVRYEFQVRARQARQLWRPHTDSFGFCLRDPVYPGLSYKQRSDQRF